MPQYRITKHEVNGLGVGEIVDLKEYEAAGFMDKLELIDGEINDPPVKQKQGGDDFLFLQSGTISTINGWLKTSPAEYEVRAYLEIEKANKNRKMAIEVLEEYLADGS